MPATEGRAREVEPSGWSRHFHGTTLQPRWARCSCRLPARVATQVVVRWCARLRVWRCSVTLRDHLATGVILVAAACAHPSGTATPDNARLVALPARLVIAQARQTLTESGFRLLPLDSATALWAIHAEAGTSFTRCMDVSGARRTLPRPVLVRVSASDTAGGATVRIEVVGWRPGEFPPLAVGVGRSPTLGPCVSNGAMERQLYRVLDLLARRRAT